MMNQEKEKQNIQNNIEIEERKKWIIDNFQTFFPYFLDCILLLLKQGIDLGEDDNFDKYNKEEIKPYLVGNWHIDLVGYQMKLILEKKLFKLIINIFPGATKTTMLYAFAVLYMAFYPSTLETILSGTKPVVDDYRQYVKKILESKFFGHFFPWIKIDQTQNRADMFSIEKYNGRFAIMTTGCKNTGMSSDLMIIDDAIDYNEFQKRKYKYIEDVNNDISGFMTRLREQKGQVPVLAVNQRICDGDNTSFLLKNFIQYKWEVIRIPACENQNKYKIGNRTGMIYRMYGKTIFREFGSMTSPTLTRSAFEGKRNSFEGKMADFEFQYQQTADNVRQDVFSLAKIGRKDPESVVDYDYKILSVDSSFGVENKDYSAITLYKLDSNINLHLVNAWGNRYEYGHLKSLIDTIIDDEMPDFIIIENKGTGIALIQEISKEREFSVYRDSSLIYRGERIISVSPTTDKESRARIANTFIQLNKFYLPYKIDKNIDKEDVNILFEIERELKCFPSGSVHDDFVDSISQCINFVRKAFTVSKEDHNMGSAISLLF